MDEYDKKRQQTPEYKAQKRAYYKRVNKFRVQRRYEEVKLEVLSHYSFGTPRCEYCGETDIRCLCIDHIDGGGSQHHREIGVGRGGAFYLWLKRNNYPDGFQVLCANCNLRKKFVEGRKGQFW